MSAAALAKQRVIPISRSERPQGSSPWPEVAHKRMRDWAKKHKRAYPRGLPETRIGPRPDQSYFQLRAQIRYGLPYLCAGLIEALVILDILDETLGAPDKPEYAPRKPDGLAAAIFNCDVTTLQKVYVSLTGRGLIEQAPIEKGDQYKVNQEAWLSLPALPERQSKERSTKHHEATDNKLDSSDDEADEQGEETAKPTRNTIRILDRPLTCPHRHRTQAIPLPVRPDNIRYDLRRVKDYTVVFDSVVRDGTLDVILLDVHALSPPGAPAPGQRGTGAGATSTSKTLPTNGQETDKISWGRCLAAAVDAGVKTGRVYNATAELEFQKLDFADQRACFQWLTASKAGILARPPEMRPRIDKIIEEKMWDLGAIGVPLTAKSRRQQIMDSI